VRVIEDVLASTETFPKVVLTLGSFDGVHLGHRLILERVVTHAQKINGTPAVLTIRPHPREFFSPDHAPNLRPNCQKKCALFHEVGIETVFTLVFNKATAALEPKEFIEEIIVARCATKAMIVGHDCRFGKAAAGDFDLLRKLGEQYGFTAEQIPALILNGERVSSTLVRERIVQGDMEEAAALLGRRYSLSGTVVKGRGLGATIGFPTANVEPLHSAVPAQGVYIAEVAVGDSLHPAAVNIGIAPTLKHEGMTVEAHLIDFSGDLVGEHVEILFHHRIRPEKKFPTVDDLIAQIGHDVETARTYLSKRDR